MTQRCPGGHGHSGGWCLRAGIRDCSRQAHGLKPLPQPVAQGRDGPSLRVQAAQAPSCCHSGETQSHHHCPAMLRTLGMALLALLIVVNPSQASGFTGEGSGLHVGDAGGARAPRRGSPEDNNPAKSGAGKAAPAGRVRDCSFLGKLSVTTKKVMGMLQNQLGVSGVQGQVLSHWVWGGTQNSAFLPVVQMLLAC